MYERTKRHYRVAQREIFEDPCAVGYVTKKAHAHYFCAAAVLIFISFLGSVALALKLSK